MGRHRGAEHARAELTEHARIRIAERFRMQPEALVAALDSLKAKRLGVSWDTRMAHYLVWSQVDGAHAVAIQNVVTGQVVTVLTLAMYANTYPSRIKGDVLQKAINRMVYAGEAPASEWRHVPCARERVHVYARQLNDSRNLFIGSWRGPVESADLRHLGTLPGFVRWVAEQIHARGGDLATVFSIAAKFPRGDLQEVPILAE